MQAILITAYKNFEHLLDLVDVFGSDMYTFIHIDKRSEIPEIIINRLKLKKQVQLVSQKYKVHWGGKNHLRAILHLSEEAIKINKIERFHLISGHDYPIKSQDQFKVFFSKHQNINYISHFELPIKQWPAGGLERYEYYNFYDLLDAKKYRNIIFKLITIQKKLRIKRSFNRIGLKFYGGDSWWSLNREALEFVVNYTKKSPKFFKRMRHTFCSEEIYFQTVLMNSKLASTLQNDSLRYIDWSSRNGNFPANLDISDFVAIKNSTKFFARKFEFPVSMNLKNKIKTYYFKEIN